MRCFIFFRTTTRSSSFAKRSYLPTLSKVFSGYFMVRRAASRFKSLFHFLPNSLLLCQEATLTFSDIYPVLKAILATSNLMNLEEKIRQKDPHRLREGPALFLLGGGLLLGRPFARPLTSRSAVCGPLD